MVVDLLGEKGYEVFVGFVSGEVIADDDPLVSIDIESPQVGVILDDTASLQSREDQDQWVEEEDPSIVLRVHLYDPRKLLVVLFDTAMGNIEQSGWVPIVNHVEQEETSSLFTDLEGCFNVVEMVLIRKIKVREVQLPDEGAFGLIED